VDGPWTPHLPQVFLLLGGGSIKNFKKTFEEKAYRYLTQHEIKSVYASHQKLQGTQNHDKK
jgi:hypothetical protein